MQASFTMFTFRLIVLYIRCPSWHNLPHLSRLGDRTELQFTDLSVLVDSRLVIFNPGAGDSGAGVLAENPSIMNWTIQWTITFHISYF